MWEYRLVWTAGKPAWWDKAWKSGAAALSGMGRQPEKRPDRYLILSDRADVGLKLRSGKEEDFDTKVLHSRANGWELWEKVSFFKWDRLEATRFAALIRERAPDRASLVGGTPTQGAKAELDMFGIAYVEMEVEKERIQASAGELFHALAAPRCNSDWLAELVKIYLPDRRQPLLSICVETMEPLRGRQEPLPVGDGLCCGYPELLLRHQRRRL